MRDLSPMKSCCVLVTALCILFSSAQVRAATATHEFIMSCTYGVMAGTLVGAASLAFVKKPSDNLNKVARGASLGLYTGILLGIYVVYIVPGFESTEEEDPIVVMERLPVLVGPTFDDQDQLDGLQASWKIYKF